MTGLRCFCVADPGSEQGAFFRDAFGGDAVELINLELWTIGTEHCLKVHLGSLGTAGLIRACRAIGRSTGVSFDEVFRCATVGKGLFVQRKGLYLCHDPELGRRLWQSSGVGKGGGDVA